MPPSAAHGEGVPAAEAEYRRLLDRSLSPVCIHDGRRVLYVNPAGVQTLAADSDALIVGRPIDDFVHPASLADMRERISSLRVDGEVSAASEVILMRVDGTTLPVQAIAAVRITGDATRFEVLLREAVPAPAAPRRESADGAAQAIITTDPHGVVTGWDADAHSMYGRSADEVVGTRIEHAVGAPLDPAAVVRAGGRESMIHYGASGDPVTVHVVVVATTDGFVVIGDRIAAVSGVSQPLYAVLDLIHDGVVIMANDGHFAYTNAAARRILGSDAGELIERYHSSSGADLPLYDAQGTPISADSHPIRWIQQTGLSLGGDAIGVDRLDGTRVWITGRGCLMDPGNPHTSAMLFSFTDITEHFDAREQLLYDATHDWLTGLPNRVHALNLAAVGLAQTGADRLSAVLFIDLDRLKMINDNHGHPIGDDVLRIAAQRMHAATREQDLVARIGGDEFVVLLMGEVPAADLDAVAQRLHDVLVQDVVVGSLVLRIGASIGVTTVDSDDERSLAEVLRDADAAMYEAKARGPANTAYFIRPEHEL